MEGTGIATLSYQAEGAALDDARVDGFGFAFFGSAGSLGTLTFVDAGHRVLDITCQSYDDEHGTSHPTYCPVLT